LLFMRHDIDIGELDFLVHIPLSEKKTSQFRSIRERFEINPARAYVCGDEHKDFVAAIGAGMHPFMVSYGFEDHDRLTTKFDIPDEVISRTSDELCRRVRHALELGAPQMIGSTTWNKESDFVRSSMNRRKRLPMQ
jgi:phosphoglycolate phosphatase